MEMEVVTYTRAERKDSREGGAEGKMTTIHKGSSSSGAMARRRRRRRGGESQERRRGGREAAGGEQTPRSRGVQVDAAVEAEQAKADREMQMKRLEEQAKADREMQGSEDDESWNAIQYRHSWDNIWSHNHGSFQDTTRIPPMRFTHNPPLGYAACTSEALQIFSVVVAATMGGLQWPLDVFGIVAVRDNLDLNRNVVFHRSRDNCQTLTEEDRNLVLTGPTRAVTLTSGPVTIDVELKVKYTTEESDDKFLSFLAVPLLCARPYCSRVLKSGSYTSKLSTLKFRLGYIVSSVEATIFVSVIDGSWPDDFRGQFAAFATGFYAKDLVAEASVDFEEIVLLDSTSEKVVVTGGDGKIELSRRVVSVEDEGELKVSVKAWDVDDNIVEKVKVFTALKAGLSNGELDIGFCKLEVTVAW